MFIILFYFYNIVRPFPYLHMLSLACMTGRAPKVIYLENMKYYLSLFATHALKDWTQKLIFTVKILVNKQKP